jgi:CubicO group peptidase (beta-lactamase class C family)
MRWIGSAVLCVALLTASARAAISADCGTPAAMSDGWEVSAPAQQGLDPTLICATGPSLAKLAGADPHGVVVVRNGVLVYEQYFTGDDQHGSRWVGAIPHDANTLHNMESITKSVVALLVGIAFDRGLLKSLDAPILSLLPEYADLSTPDKDQITLRHLLSMTSGLDWPERAIPSNDPGNILRYGYVSPDPYRFVLERPIGAPPGTAWNYNGGGVWLLGTILRKVAGQPLDQFAKEALFEPLGIEEWEWATFPNGDPGTSGSLQLRPRDLAKIGQLVLDNGVWQGRRIVSADWIKQMTARQSPSRFSFGSWRSYGYLWWQGRSSIDNQEEIDWVGAVGRGGQRLYVVPTLRLVVAVTAGLYLESKGGAPSPRENLAGDTALNSFVLPAALGH